MADNPVLFILLILFSLHLHACWKIDTRTVQELYASVQGLSAMKRVHCSSKTSNGSEQEKHRSRHTLFVMKSPSF